MNLARYFVTPFGNEWLISLEGSVLGRYRSRMEATEAAISMADLRDARKSDADVMVESEPGGPLEPVWTSGHGRLAALPRQHGATEPPRRHIHMVQRGEAA